MKFTAELAAFGDNIKLPKVKEAVFCQAQTICEAVFPQLRVDELGTTVVYLI